ncbi:hypothetical protein [Pyruvatibacter sp.]
MNIKNPKVYALVLHDYDGYEIEKVYQRSGSAAAEVKRLNKKHNTGNYGVVEVPFVGLIAL